MRWLWHAGVGTLTMALVCGCGTPREGNLPLPPGAHRSPTLAEQGPQPVDEPGPLLYDESRLDRGRERLPGEQAQPLSPNQAPDDGTSTAPQPPEFNRYMTIGAVIVEVGGAPIYTDKIVRDLEDVFAAEAKQRDLESFRQFAAAEIRKQVEVEIREEIYFAEALKSLSQQEQQQAEALATRYHQSLISDAGGSVEVARRLAREEGWDLDHRVRDRYRKLMVDLYLYKRVFPRVSVKPQDIRNYYARNVDDPAISQPEQLQFRIIAIQQRKVGSREQAQEKINELRRRLESGEEFAQLAQDYSHEFASRGGEIGWVNRGAFVHEAVENAVAQLQPGQFTEVIESGDTFFIARLEGHRPRQVRPFSDPAVQKRIEEILHSQQVAQMSQKAIERLQKDAIINPPNYSIEPAVELAMQRYQQWRGRTSAAAK
jgi:parvulin-like peptidyl-prolyl isomerase